jgi:hypothetical protein
MVCPFRGIELRVKSAEQAKQSGDLPDNYKIRVGLHWVLKSLIPKLTCPGSLINGVPETSPSMPIW